MDDFKDLNDKELKARRDAARTVLGQVHEVINPDVDPRDLKIYDTFSENQQARIDDMSGEIKKREGKLDYLKKD